MARRTDVPFSASLNLKANGFSVHEIPSSGPTVDDHVFSGPTALQNALDYFNSLYSKAVELKTEVAAEGWVPE